MAFIPASNQHILTVSELNFTVRRLLESEFSGIWLIGEISNFSKPSSGHWYFSLKDDKAQIRGAMFRGNNSACRITPKNGTQVLVRARLSLYEPRGDYQIIVEQMEPAGEGLLQQQFEFLKNQLAAQGLFAQANKKALPSVIQRVGIVTSPTGAAVKDIIAVLQRRAPQLAVIIYPTAVQGQPATQQICHMIQTADIRHEVDVLIVGRGGGSLEDLWCFNEEAVAWAIYHCTLPVISAVGHEVDVTIADFVADIRAATPSAAAELVSPDQQAMMQQMQQWLHRLYKAQQHQLIGQKNKVSLLEQQLLRSHPQNVLNSYFQTIDELSFRLHNGIKQQIAIKRSAMIQLNHQFKMQQGLLNLGHQRTQLDQLANRLSKNIQQALIKARMQRDNYAKQLHMLSPLSTLNRGYSITSDDHQQVLHSIQQVKPGQMISTRLADGIISSQIIGEPSKA